MDQPEDQTALAFLPYRPLVPAAVAFACGILACEYSLLPRRLAWSAIVVAAAGSPACRWLGLRGTALLLLGVGMTGAGWVRLDLTRGTHPPHHISRFLGDEPTLVRLRGVVASDPEVRVLPPMPLSGDSGWLAAEARQTRFDLDCLEAEVGGDWRAVCGRLRVVDHGAPRTLCHGDTVVLVGTAHLPSGPTNPGQMDGATLLRRGGIDATLSVGERGTIVETGSNQGGFFAMVYAARGALRRTLQTTLASDKHSAALLCALVLGDRTEVGEDLEEAFARTGTIHLLAVSGFNVGVVAWVVWSITALLGLRRRLSGALVLCVVIAYALVTGAPPSVVRAAVMTGVFLLAILGRRQFDPVQAVAVAALVLLVLRPFDLFSVGFQLSFVAVLGIILLNRDFAALLRPRVSLFDRLAADEEVSRSRRLLRWTWVVASRAAAVSLAAWLAVLPLTASYFHLVSPITVVANLLAAPLAAMLTVLGFAHTATAAALPALAGVPAAAAQAIAWALTGVVRLADSVPLAWQYCAAPALGWVIGYYALGLLVVGRRRLGLSGMRAAMLWVAGVVVYLVAPGSTRPPEGMEVTALDVRRGNATVLRFPDGSTALYDCGTYGRNDVGRWVAAPALWHWGVRTIDLLVVSHADADHVNGIPSLLQRFKIGHVVHSPVLARAKAGRQLLEMLRKRGIPASPVKAGDRIEVGKGNVVEVLSPTDWLLRLRPNEQNENSLVVRVAHAGRRVLLCGDIQQVGATVLLHAGIDLRADVLVVPHHGRLMPATPEFAQAVRPAYAICSNRADHLPPATVAAYESAGAHVLATCWDGAVTVTIRHGEVEAAGWKKKAGP
ncbi:MAG TPA: DNA internalization-related competence protein ComEC/Rec2 [Planctomycetota bacterium]|nr:DNA internalization-related competence protein ComEC/Rec2 [Planctomycetota bacterium]